MRPFSMAATLCALCLMEIAFVHTASAADPMQYPAREPASGASGSTTGWMHLQEKGPGHDALVTLRDGTMRGGWITQVDADKLHLQTAGAPLALASAAIASVRVKRSDRTLLYSFIGYVVTGAVSAIVVYNDDDHAKKDMVVTFGVGGIPGALLGALIGRRTSGDIEIIP